MTKVTGVVGWPVAEKLSPYVYNAGFQALGLDWVYLGFPVQPDRLAAALRGLPALGIAGVNLSLPHKAAAVALMDEVSEKARLVGSVNTVLVRGDGSLYGHNTEGEGFLRGLGEELGVHPNGLKVTLLGAGEVARNIAASLALAGAAEVAIFDAVAGRAEEVAALVGQANAACAARVLSRDELPGATEAAELVVNATPVGMWPNVEAVPTVNPAWLHKGQVLCDVIHNPPETQLVQLARKRGVRAMGGLRMLVYQGALGFQAWTGLEAPRDAMYKAVLSELDRRAAEA